MILDAHTPCPACPQIVRTLYVTALRVLQARDCPRLPEVEELFAAVDAVRPWVEAHHVNQEHAFSFELEDARAPQLTVVPVDHEGSQR